MVPIGVFLSSDEFILWSDALTYPVILNFCECETKEPVFLRDLVGERMFSQ